MTIRGYTSDAVVGSRPSRISVPSGAGFNRLNFLNAGDSGLEAGLGNWTVGTNCTVAQDATWARTGTKSLKLTPTGVGPAAQLAVALHLLPVIPGGVYRISAYGTAAGGLTRNITLIRATFTAADGFVRFSSGSSATFDAAAGVFTQSILDFTAEATTAWLQIQVSSSNMTNGGTEFAWFDDITVARIG